jgi:diguanylate cyclase (GGDEF)-like protein/putative nucleotidyltransferase with HDIG domain
LPNGGVLVMKQGIADKMQQIAVHLETKMGLSIGTKILVPFFIVMLIVIMFQYYFVSSMIGDYVSTIVPNKDILLISSELSEVMLRTTVLAILLVVFWATAIARLMVGPLQKMLKITKAIAQGDFSHKNEIVSKDEFGELGEAINNMGEKIKERLDYAEHLATVDGLTGLFNHRCFQQRLLQEIQRIDRTGSALSLIILDIDCFKHYNDHLGHPAGDKVLQEISQILLRSIRSVDIAARYGGEEFAIILVDSDAVDAYAVGERIRCAVERYPFEGRQEQPAGKLTVSLGIASYPNHAGNKDDLIKFADDAMYKAKHISKNKVVLYYSVLDELKVEIDKSEHDLLNTVKTLISVINSRDKYTYGHSERVVHYAVSMAEAFGFAEKHLRNMKVAAYLHDIGKIEIDREILNKKEPLTTEEMNLLRQHSCWGAEIVSSIDSLKNIAPVILCHHEKYDGSGYPAGLKGNNIPLQSRILKLADSFDAMTSMRPYQPVKSFGEARQELQKCAGSDFDPMVVDVFLESWDKKGLPLV